MVAGKEALISAIVYEDDHSGPMREGDRRAFGVDRSYDGIGA
jgi:hypothetical protein